MSVTPKETATLEPLGRRGREAASGTGSRKWSTRATLLLVAGFAVLIWAGAAIAAMRLL